MKQTLVLALTLMVVNATPAASEVIELDGESWNVTAAEGRVEQYLGQESLYMLNGNAVLENVEFTNGVIEYDVAFALERGFLAVIWRMQDGGNFEEFYLRPHQSGKADANQYTPEFNRLAGWQMYFGPQFSAPTTYRENAWNHVKVVVNGKRADIYVNSEEPVLHIPEMKRETASGGIALTSFVVGVHYAKVQVTPMDDPAIIGTPPEPEVMAENAVRDWSISSVFEGASLDGKTMLNEGDTDGLTWQTLGVEGRGYANIARVTAQLPRPEATSDAPQPRSTIFAATKINAEKAGVRKISFGYSDSVRVYLNGRLLYGGDNTYRSRDFRYLGTIGLFDSLYLPLEKGENELLFAVEEAFGGWGIMAALADPAGLTITP